MLLISQLWMQKYGRKWNIGQNCQENGVRQMRACVAIQMFCEFQTLSRTQAGSLSRPPSGGVPCLAGGAVKTCCHVCPGGPFGSPSLWKVGGQSGTCNKLSPHRNHYKLRSSCLGSKGSGPVDWPCDSEVIWGPELEMWPWLVLGLPGTCLGTENLNDNRMTQTQVEIFTYLIRAVVRDFDFELWKVFCSPDQSGLLHTIQTASILKVTLSMLSTKFENW